MAADGKLPTRLISKARGATNWVLTHTPSGPEWQPPAASGLAIVDDDEPASPATGQLWYDTDASC